MTEKKKQKTPKKTADQKSANAAMLKDDGLKPQPREFLIPKKKKLAIVGCSHTNKQTPFADQDYEFWGVNNLFTSLRGPYTRWFDIHKINYDEKRKCWLRRGKIDFRGMPVDLYLRTLQSLDIPVYMRAACPMVPNAVIYPMEEVVNSFPHGDYLTNTISMMIAFGIIAGHFEQIDIYGVDMAVDTEYFWQRPSCEYFIGLAESRGIKVYLPDECDLLKTRFIYGWDEDLEDRWNKKLNEMRESLQNRITQYTQKKKEAFVKQQQGIGAIGAINEIDKIWSNLK